MQLKSLAFAAALSLTAFSASALTLQPYEVSKGSKTFADTGAFTDVHLIEFGAGFDDFPAAELGFALTEVKLGSFVDIDFGSVAFYAYDGYNPLTKDITGAAFKTLTPMASSGPADSVSTEFSYSTSPFWMVVTGSAVGTGPTKGSYSFEMVAAPVPEPQTYAMVLGGLAMIGWVAARRRAG